MATVVTGRIIIPFMDFRLITRWMS